jgi:hypothetical protein
MSNFRGFNLQSVQDTKESSHTFTAEDNPHTLDLPLLILLLVVITGILIGLFYMLVDGYKCNKFKRYITNTSTKAKQSPYMSPSPSPGTMPTPLPLYKRDKTSTHVNMFQPNELYKEKFSYEPLEIDNNYRVSFYAVVEQTPTQYI